MSVELMLVISSVHVFTGSSITRSVRQCTYGQVPGQALADVLPSSGIRLTPDKAKAHLIAEAEVETPLRLEAGGVSEIAVAGARFANFRRRSRLVRAG